MENATSQFIEIDLASELEFNEAQGARILDPVKVSVGGYPANHIRTEVMTPKTAQRSDYYIIVRGYYRYILSLSSPLWLTDDYGPILDAVLEQTRVVEPDILQAAHVAVNESSNPATQAHLGQALILAGETQAGWKTLERAMAKWPLAGEPTAIAAEIHYYEQTEPERACSLVIHALQHREWTPELITLAYNLLKDCEEKENAFKVLEAGIKRFPKNKALKRKQLRHK